MKYFSEKTVSSLPIPTHLDLFDLLPLRDLFRKFLINICFKTSQDQYLLGHK